MSLLTFIALNLVQYTVHTKGFIVTEHEQRPRAHLAPAASRAVRLLDFLALTPQVPQPLTVIAAHLSAAKSSILNICTVLEEAGFIEKRPGGYVLGRRVLELGGAYIRRFDVVRSFYRLADESAVLHDELVQLGMLFGTDVLYLARKEASRASLRLTAGIGEALPAASTAIGRSILARMPWEDVAELIGTESLSIFTKRSVRGLDDLRHELDSVRTHGYALDRGGVFPNVTGVAVALAVTAGERPMALSASIVDPDRNVDVTPIAQALRELAGQLSNPMVQLDDGLQV